LSRYRKRLLVPQGDRIRAVNVCDIDWVGSAGNFVTLHVGKVSYLYRSTLAALEESLDPEMFVRIHRQHIVNRNFRR
jgi:two-component system LytT family response regulator